MDLRIWWIPQVPGPTFRRPVASLLVAKQLLDTLAEYDLFQLDHNIKPDYTNAGGLEILEDGEWVDWCDGEGYDIDSYDLTDAGLLRRP